MSTTWRQPSLLNKTIVASPEETIGVSRVLTALSVTNAHVSKEVQRGDMELEPIWVQLFNEANRSYATVNCRRRMFFFRVRNI